MFRQIVTKKFRCQKSDFVILENFPDSSHHLTPHPQFRVGPYLFTADFVGTPKKDLPKESVFLKKIRAIRPEFELLFLFIAILLVSSNVSARDPEKITIYVDEHPLLVEVVNTPTDRARGLMYRKHLAENEGMLFVFSEPDYLSFWMKNTWIPLSIAYFNRDKRITDIHDMKPNQTTELYHSSEKALYALEVNQGWFAKRKIGKYGVLKLPDRVKAAQ